MSTGVSIVRDGIYRYAKKASDAGMIDRTDGVNVQGYKAVGTISDRTLYYSKCGKHTEFYFGRKAERVRDPEFGVRGYHGCIHPLQCLKAYDACTGEEDRDYVVTPAVFSGVVKIDKRTGAIVGEEVTITGRPVASYFWRPDSA